MANKMIIDASHPEETRVVVLRGNRVEEFDFESANKRPLRGNIYLAKVTRVEPSLQAAFVDYGGNRHGFLAFSEIHPDYYQIPIADRQALLEEEALSQRDEEDEPNGERRSRRHRRPRRPEVEARVSNGDAFSEPAASEGHTPNEPSNSEGSGDNPPLGFEGERLAGYDPANVAPVYEVERESAESDHVEYSVPDAERTETSAPAAEHEPAPLRDQSQGDTGVDEHPHGDDDQEVTTLEAGLEERSARHDKDRLDDEGEPVEQIGGDAMEEVPRRPHRLRRQYKIQEVIKRRQVLLVQVVKEERGNKGAALTTYLSLAGRYSVLMPNTARGGGISRKITNAQDRSRLKSIAEELDVPEGMGVILRTAGASRTKAEVKRDFEYLLRMWETVRETTLASSAPTLVYEEGSLIKRAIRDLYSKEVDEIVVAGETGYREARQFMRLLMPSHVNAVQLYRDTQPVFAKAGVETQLDALFSNQVTLKSGGYIVINQAEALVAIDVNSGRSTREHNIEDTALRTNIEAADEIARQLRLRDLAGLIVVDFIDMEESRNNRAVERRIKDALKNDRARIQVGRISHFGLLEMSRQRIRTGVLEGSTVVCAHCQGAGVVRSTASIALHVLRALEDALIKSSTHDVVVRTRTAVALYILNQKRANLRDLERRFGVTITIESDDTLTGANYHAIERGEIASGVKGSVEPPTLARDEFATIVDEPPLLEEEAEEESEPPADEAEGIAAGHPIQQGAEQMDEGEVARRRRRRRRRRSGERSFGESVAPDAPQPTDDGLAAVAEISGDLKPSIESIDSIDRRGPRSEGGRNGRRSRRSRGLRNQFPEQGEGSHETQASEPPETQGSEPRAPINPEFSPRAGETSEPFSTTSESFSAEKTEEHSEASRPPKVEGPDIQDWGQEPRSPSAARIDPSVSARQLHVPEESLATETLTKPGPEPTAEEPSRPRRSGWWQRARASIVGD
jgi:ribonuclease E